jgi:hypothetical protein
MHIYKRQEKLVRREKPSGTVYGAGNLPSPVTIENTEGRFNTKIKRE